MADFETRPASSVSGAVAVPGDKSISHRSLMLSGIAEGTSEVTGFLASEDCLASLAAMRALGVRIDQQSPTHVLIHGVGLRGLRAAGRALDMGNAGTAMRLFTGLLAAQTFDSQLIGDASLMKRPMERVAKPLREMGADVRTRQGTPPVDIVGGHRLHGIEYRMPVASAQVKSALLLAALYADGATTVIAPDITRDHSERMLASCGVRLDIAGLRITLHPPQRVGESADRCAGGFLVRRLFHRGGAVGGRGLGIVDSKTSGSIRLAPDCSIYCAAWAADIDVHEPALQRGGTGGGSVGARVVLARHPGSRGTRAARHRRTSGIVHRRRLCGGRDGRDGRGRAAGEGERPDRCHERRP